MITRHEALTDSDIAAVEAAARAAADADGVAPLSEAYLLGLHHPGSHWVAEGTPVPGYAQLAEDGSAELFVVPDERTKGVGRALAEAVLATRPDAGLWAHGDLPASRSLASSLGLEVVRELLVLSRPLRPEDGQDPALLDGYRARPFVPGRDDAELLAVNAAAFAAHPEQGGLDQAGLDERMALPWFDPQGLILVEDVTRTTPQLAAFHWTKVETGQDVSGEVYVVGVRPDHQGRGLGGPLTGLGLAHLARRGLSEVELYVEADNHPALRVYERAGFTRAAVHVLHSPTGHPRLP